MRRTVLYHWTCDHGRRAIGDAGLVYPAIRVADKAVTAGSLTWWVAAYSWWTDIAVASDDARAQLGLTHRLVRHDRMAHRYRIDPADAALVKPWATVRRHWPAAFADELESAPGADPSHWWLAWQPARAAYAPNPLLREHLQRSPK